jgi:hypothetical protein
LTPVVACTGSHRSACVGFFPGCDLDASRPQCRSLIAADSSVYFLNPEHLEGLVPPNELATFLGPEVTPDSFVAKAAGADAVWYYDASGPMDGGGVVGHDGRVAVSGCTALAQLTLVIYN